MKLLWKLPSFETIFPDSLDVYFNKISYSWKFSSWSKALNFFHVIESQIPHAKVKLQLLSQICINCAVKFIKIWNETVPKLVYFCRNIWHWSSAVHVLQFAFMKYSLAFHPFAVHLWTPIYIQVFIVNYLKAHASIGVSINSIEYVMRILSGADCKDEREQMKFSISALLEKRQTTTSMHN